MHRVPQAGARYLAHEAAISMGAGTERTDEATEAVRQETPAPTSGPLVRRLSPQSIAAVAQILNCRIIDVLERYA